MVSEAKVRQEIQHLESKLQELKTKQMTTGLSNQERGLILETQRNIGHKQRVLASLLRREGAKQSLIEKHEAGIFGEGADPEFVKVGGKKLEELQKQFGTQVKQGELLSDIQARIKSGEIKPLEVRTREERVRLVQAPPTHPGELATLTATIRPRGIEELILTDDGSIIPKQEPLKELTPSERRKIRKQLGEKPIQQTVSKIEPFDIGQKKKRPTATIELREPELTGVKRITEPKELIGRDIAKQLQEAPLIDKPDIFFTGAVEFAQQEKSKVLRPLLIGGATFIKTTYDLTLGIPITAVKEGPAEAVLQFNPVRLIKALKQDKILLSKTPEGRIAETLGILGGVKAGAGLTGRILEPPIRSFQRHKKSLAFEEFSRKLDKQLKDMELGEFKVRKQLEQQRFTEITESGIELPQFQDPLKPKFKQVFEPMRTELMEVPQDISRPIKRPTPPEIEMPKPTTRPRPSEIITLTKEGGITVEKIKPTQQAKLLELEKGQAKSQFTQEFTTPELSAELILFEAKETGLFKRLRRSKKAEAQLRQPELVFEERLKTPTTEKISLNLPEVKPFVLPPSIKLEQEQDIFFGVGTADIGTSDILRDTRLGTGQEISLALDLTQAKKPALDLGDIQDPIREQERERDRLFIPAIDITEEAIPEQELEIKLDLPIEPKKKPKPKEPLLRFPDEELPGLQDELPLFDVFAKEKGKFIKINTEPIPKVKALNLGANVVDNTASATFKLKDTTKTGVAIDDFSFQKKQKFRKKGNAYIELIRDRIDTPGEIQGITVKGWLAQKRRGGF